jgi:tRNA pseudouridine55 synthase
MFGVVNLNKPAGWSSRDAVDRVERFVRPAKAGHAGTLDPLASGVLVVCIEPATRLIEYLQRMPKEYRATFLLGRWSASDDIETDVVALADAVEPASEMIGAATGRFVGVIEQRPPAFSAVKVEGRRAYKLARRGEAVQLAPRKVEIYSLAIERYKYPELELSIRCSGGTYVRSLGRDLAESLGTSAVMSALVRTAVGAFRIEKALSAKGLTEAKLREHLLSPLTAIPDLPRVRLSDEQVAHAQRGGLFATEELMAGEWRGEVVAAVNERGELIALLKEARAGFFKPSPNFFPME